MVVNISLVWQDIALQQGLYQGDGMLYFTNGEQLPQTLTLVQSWAQRGIYIFVPADFKGDEIFVKKLLTLVVRSPERSFIWVANPEEQVTKWRWNVILCDETQQGGFAARSSRIGIIGCEIFVTAGVLIDCNGQDFEIVCPTQGSYALSLRVGHMVMVQDMEGAAILADGTLSFRVIADPGGGELFESLGVKMQYACEWQGGTVHERALSGGLCRLEASPLVYNGSLSLQCMVQPAMHDARAQLMLPPGVEMESAFSTTAGAPLALITTDSSALGLCYAPHHLFSAEGSLTARQEPYLCPQGRFSLRAVRANGSIKLLCGLAGTEYLEIGESGADIVFSSGESSFISKGGEGTERFLQLCTAPWIVLPEQTAYISQPQAAPLYTGDPSAPLRFMGAPTLIIPGNAPPVPMLPYRLARVLPENSWQISKPEAQLSGARSEILQTAAKSFTHLEKDVQTAVTPQGLMAGITANGEQSGEWAWIGLANTTGQSSALPNMRLTDISPAMRYSYQTVELRCFYSCADEITDNAGTSMDYNFSVDGWTFHTAPGEWRKAAGGTAPTVMIVQLCTGKSINEWLGGEPVVMASLEAVYDENKKVKAVYADFERAMNDPLFQGIMVLNCPVSVDKSCPAFPKALGAVLDTIEQEKLCAHHLIVRRSQIGCENKQLVMKSSDVSAVVDYRQATSATYSVTGQSRDYSFCTTEFLLAVVQQRITRVESVSELTINRLFCTECTKEEGSAGNSLVIEGCLQEGEVPIYSYTLREAGVYKLQNSAITQLEVETLTLAVTGECRFVIGGQLFFKMYEAADLFSYGCTEGKETASGLRFDGLCIIGKTDELMADYAELLLRSEDSIPREQSFAARFPAVPRRLVFSISGDLPQELGYLSIETPLQQSKAETPWFGIEYEINPGSLGGLSDGGGFCLKLLAAWNAQDGGCYFGIMLPGTNVLMLQGIFQLGFSAISLERSGSDGLGYMLVLNQFAIKVLGFTFPPGENRLCLIADKDTRKLGWYAAYKGD